MPPDIIYELPPAGIFLCLLGLTGLVAIILHRVLASPRLKYQNERLADLSPAVMTLCGTLFVLSVTFLANAVWTSEDRARETVNTEARSIRVMEDYMEAMTGPSRDGLNQIVATYARAVAAEWDVMCRTGGSAEAERALKDLYNAVLRGFAEGDRNRIIQQRLLAALDQLSTARERRLSMAQDFVSGGQWFLVSALGLLLLVMVAIGHGRSGPARAVALSAISLAISVAIYVILVNDRPFIGYNAVTPNAILAAAGVGV